MSESSWSTVIGSAGALCSTLAYWPQLLKVRRQGGHDLSRTMLALVAAGAALWLGYGLLNGATAVVAANAAVIVLVSTVAATAARRGGGRGEMSRRRRIAIDMDEVIADSLSEHLRRYNERYGTTLRPEDVVGRMFETSVPAEHRAETADMLDGSFFEDLAVLPDAQAVVRELAERHEIFIASAAMDVPRSFDAKYRWLRRHFPFIAPTHIVFCGDKSIVDADYLIDDQPRNLAGFRGQPLLFSAPHNATEARYPRVSSWKEVREWFERLD